MADTAATSGSPAPLTIRTSPSPIGTLSRTASANPGSFSSILHVGGMTRPPSLIRNTDAPSAPAMMAVSLWSMPLVTLPATPLATTPRWKAPTT